MAEHVIVKDRIGLGVRQPWVELILQGVKTLEIRSSSVAYRGTIYLYSSKKFTDMPAAETAAEANRLDVETLPLGVVVGTVDIADCRPATAADAAASCVPWDVMSGKLAWELTNPVRFDEPISPRFLPYGVWFYPFQRRNQK